MPFLNVEMSITVLRKGHGGKYVINGEWVLGRSGKFEAGGTTFTYHRPSSEASRDTMEYITAPGPTNMSMVIEVRTD